MEVHAHTHTERKRLKHYLFEFFMLFLAVFCGFLAENQREHFAEKKREKQFMVSLVKDLELDTSQLDRIKRTREKNLINIDTLTIFFASNHSKMVPFKIYTLSRSLLG